MSLYEGNFLPKVNVGEVFILLERLRMMDSKAFQVLTYLELYRKLSSR